MIKKKLLKEAFKRGYMMAIKSLNEKNCDPADCKKKLKPEEAEEDVEEEEEVDETEKECPEKEIAKKFAKTGGNVGCSKFNQSC